MALYLKSADDIQALIDGPDYASIDTATKTKIAEHFEAMPAGVLEAAYDIIVVTLPTDQANFATALFTTAPTAPTAPASPGTPTPPATTPASSTDERAGLIPIPAGADQVTIPFTPAFSAAPLPPQCTVLKGSPADDNITVEDIQSLTAAECVAVLSAPTGNPNYQLSFRALAAQ